jgi:hypothetical protein
LNSAVSFEVTFCWCGSISSGGTMAGIVAVGSVGPEV